MAIGIVLLIFILIDGHSLLKHDVTWLQSPRITPWGVWGPKDFCSMNSFVIGVRLKMDHKHIGDNTALNAVQLVCTTMYVEDVDSVTSATGRFGEYGKINYCPSGFATGYQFRSQTGQGNARDDVAAVDFKLICNDINGTMSYAIENDNRWLSWGDWTQERHCPSKTAVCGIRTQVEELGDNVRKQDETTLNNVDVACCPVSKQILICQLKHSWETRIGCSVEATNCEIRMLTGMIENQQLSMYKKLFDKLEEFDEYVMKVLKIKAEKYTEKISYSSLKYIISKTTLNNKISSVGVKCEGIIQQLVVTCDFIQLYTYENRCVPDQYAEKGIIASHSNMLTNTKSLYDNFL